MLSALPTKENKNFLDLATTKLRRWRLDAAEPKLVDSLDLPNPSGAAHVELSASHGYLLGGNGMLAFSLGEKLKQVLHAPGKLGDVEGASSQAVADAEFLTVEHCRLRKYQHKGTIVVELQREAAVHNLLEIYRGVFARSGDRVMILSREPGSPVRVWSIAGPKAELLFERKSKAGGTNDQAAALSPDGMTVLISETARPLIVWSSDKQGKYAPTTFGDKSINHQPLGISDDGRFALTVVANELCLWRSDEVAKPISSWKIEEPKEGNYRELRVYPTADGWRAMFSGPGEIKFTDLVDIVVSGKEPTFTRGKRVEFNVQQHVGGNLFLRTLATRPVDFSMHWVLEDRSVTPPVEEMIPMPADFGGGRHNWGGIFGGISPSGKTLMACNDSVGHVILFDRATKKTIWQHDFAALLWRVELLDETRLMLIYGNGVIEVVDTKVEVKK